MSIQRFAAFEHYESCMEKTEMSNSFVVDIENLSPSTNDNSPTANSRISVKLQRNLSRKGSQREDNKKTILSAFSGSGNTDTSSSTDATSTDSRCYAHKSTAPSPIASLGEKLSINEQQKPRIPLSAETGWNCRRFIKQRASLVDPRRVLFFFATLSSIGTIILIYFTLSISNFSGSSDTQAHQ